MEWDTLTAEQLAEKLQVFGENDHWECKAAALLGDKGALKSELGKQVSAFANSGGGFIAIGVADETFRPEECEQTVGRQRMADFLSTMVEQAVDYPLREFKIRRIPFEADREKSVFVIEIGDSQAAPHQSRADQGYYYRIHGHSKKAPHFHIELLRNRLTRAVLNVKEVSHVVTEVEALTDGDVCAVRLDIVIENVSMQAASHWGVHINMLVEVYGWTVGRSDRELFEGHCEHGKPEVLLPGEVSQVNVAIRCRRREGGLSRARGLAYALSRFVAQVSPVSQNHVDNGVIVNWSDRSTELSFRRTIADYVRAWSIPGFEEHE